MTHRDAFSLFLLTRAHVWHQLAFRRHDPTCDMASRGTVKAEPIGNPSDRRTFHAEVFSRLSDFRVGFSNWTGAGGSCPMTSKCGDRPHPAPITNRNIGGIATVTPGREGPTLRPTVTPDRPPRKLSRPRFALQDLTHASTP